MSFLLRLAIVVAVIALVWWVTRPKFDFTILVRGEQISLQGRMAQAHWRQVAQFLREQELAGQTMRISGRRRPDGRWQLRFRGARDQGQQQRIRNFLLELL